MDPFDNAPETALAWHKAGKGAALATVVETWGSAPRQVGAQLVVSGEGEMEGSVSGGCVEGAVVLEAMEALENGAAKLLEYGVSDDDAFAVGLACGGTIRVLVEPIGAAMPADMLDKVVTARSSRSAVQYHVNTENWARSLTEEVSRQKSAFEEDGKTFKAVHNPPLRLAIVGAVHIAQALVPMARVAGFDPVVIDPRGAFGSEARFPGETILAEWPDEALTEYGLDAHTALVLLTHDPKLDDPALHQALKSDVFYIGALGSKKTHAKRVARLEEAGFSSEQIGRVHGPIGLDIGAKSPPEIAVSILAEMIQSLRRG
ncbi:MAG: XdhC family protein [Pseudomonadota bacterium]